MDNFKFDIQLFAEDASADNTVGVEQLLEGDSEPAQDQGEPDWKIDADGNATFSDNFFDGDTLYSNKEQTVEEPKEEEPKESVQDELPPAPEFYTVKVDGVEQKVTLDQLKSGYMMQADYTRKSQQLADERRAFEATKGQAMQQPQQQPQEPQFNPKEYYQNLSKYAIGRVEANLGDKFDEMSPVHQAALADEIATIKAEMYTRNQAQMGMQRVQQKYSQDPNYAEIDTLATQLLQQLPYAQAVQIQNALRNNDAQVIDEYMSAVRDQYYRSKGYIPESEIQSQQAVQSQPKVVQQKKAVPPHVESTGVAQDGRPRETKIDYSKLGRLSMDQQAEIAAKLGLGT